MDEWRSEQFRGEAFPDAAQEALASAIPDRAGIDAEDIADWVIDGSELPFQQHFDSAFGEPPVTLFWHPRFYIEALFWDSATPAIHNHTFSGAFMVLAGSSLQTRYQFDCVERISECLEIGDLRVTETELLPIGSVRTIRPRQGLIHSVFHLESPSVTLVARTHSDANREGRFEYFPPAVAWDSSAEDQGQTRRLQMLALLARVGSPRYLPLALQVVKSDMLSAFAVLRQAIVAHQAGPDVVQSLYDSIVSTYGPGRAQPFLASAAGAQRQLFGARLRSRLRKHDLRLFLGLLLAQPDWPSIERCLRAMRPALDPPTSVVQWITEFAKCGALPFELDEAGGIALQKKLSGDVKSSDDSLNRFRALPLLAPLLMP